MGRAKPGMTLRHDPMPPVICWFRAAIWHEPDLCPDHGHDLGRVRP